MATDNNYKLLGIGKKLVLYAEQWAKDQDKEYIELHAREEAIGFYEKLGYKSMGPIFLEVYIKHIKMEKVLV